MDRNPIYVLKTPVIQFKLEIRNNEYGMKSDICTENTGELEIRNNEYGKESDICTENTRIQFTFKLEIRNNRFGKKSDIRMKKTVIIEYG